MIYDVQHSATRGGTKHMWHVNDDAISIEIGTLTTADGTPFRPQSLTVTTNTEHGSGDWYVAVNGRALAGPDAGSIVGLGISSPTGRDVSRQALDAPESVLDFIDRRIPDAAIWNTTGEVR